VAIAYSLQSLLLAGAWDPEQEVYNFNAHYLEESITTYSDVNVRFDNTQSELDEKISLAPLGKLTPLYGGLFCK